MLGQTVEHTLELERARVGDYGAFPRAHVAADSFRPLMGELASSQGQTTEVSSSSVHSIPSGRKAPPRASSQHSSAQLGEKGLQRAGGCWWKQNTSRESSMHHVRRQREWAARQCMFLAHPCWQDGGPVDAVRLLALMAQSCGPLACPTNCESWK